MQRLQGPSAVLLSLALICPQSSLAAPGSPPAAPTTKRPVYQSSQLQGDARILHALNRFTFGPRPGDLEAVRAIGLDKWFDRQLHPGNLDQSDLAARLARFPAMQWSVPDLLFRLPSNAVIRQAIDGKAPVPGRGALQAVYRNQMQRVQVRRQEQEQKKALAQAQSAQASSSMTGSTAAESRMEMAPAMDAASAPAQMSIARESPSQPPFDESEFARLLALPPPQRIARLSAMPQADFDSFLKSLKQPQRSSLVYGLTPGQKEVIAALENPQRLVNEELIAQRLTRDLYSRAQLQEVMTDFWLNHFNVFLHKNEETPYYLVGYERDVIRPRALGKFEDLLEATAHSPAMLLYLDNSGSIGPDSMAASRAQLATARNPAAKAKAHEGLNENYARELMELHTLGVNGGYTQADVTQVARVLTGWTVDRPRLGGGFRFDPNRHEPGTKKVLGVKIKEQGELEGRQLLHLLATRPATAQFLSRKLAVRFVSDDPPQALVDRMAHSYLASGGDIAQVLTTLFHSPEFWSTTVYRAKIKTPIEFVVSAARASNATLDNLQPLANALRDLGMPLYGSVPPTGYKWDAADWVSTAALVNRMNFALSLAANRLPGVTVDWTQQGAESGDQDSLVPAGPIPGPEAEEPRLESLLIAGGVSDSTRSAVLQQFAAQNVRNPAAPALERPALEKPALEKQDQLLAGLLLGSPEFQRR